MAKATRHDATAPLLRIILKQLKEINEKTMKVPLIASINKRTINLKDNSLMVKMYRNGETEAVKSPYTPYFYTEDDRWGD